jgi:hypothetical protein
MLFRCLGGGRLKSNLAWEWLRPNLVINATLTTLLPFRLNNNVIYTILFLTGLWPSQ